MSVRQRLSWPIALPLRWPPRAATEASNNRLERTGSTPAAQPERSPHGEGAGALPRLAVRPRQWDREMDKTNRARVEVMTGRIGGSVLKVRARATLADSNRA
jgi:hypothetical protein